MTWGKENGYEVWFVGSMETVGQVCWWQVQERLWIHLVQDRDQWGGAFEHGKDALGSIKFEVVEWVVASQGALGSVELLDYVFESICAVSPIPSH
jgi:hypothetical protein